MQLTQQMVTIDQHIYASRWNSELGEMQYQIVGNELEVEVPNIRHLTPQHQQLIIADAKREQETFSMQRSLKAVQGLALLMPLYNVTAASSDVVLKAKLEDLEDFCSMAIERACKDIRKMEDNAFFPTSAKLRKYCMAWQKAIDKMASLSVYDPQAVAAKRIEKPKRKTLAELQKPFRDELKELEAVLDNAKKAGEPDEAIKKIEAKIWNAKAMIDFHEKDFYR